MHLINDDQLNAFCYELAYKKDVYPPECKTLWNVMYNTGCRANEAIELDRWNIISENTISLVPQKFSDERTFQIEILPPSFVEAIQAGHKSYRLMNYRMIQYQLRNLIGGYQITIGNKASLHHLFRHNYARKLKSSGKTDYDIRLYMGERTQKSTNDYIYSRIYSRVYIDSFLSFVNK